MSEQRTKNCWMIKNVLFSLPTVEGDACTRTYDNSAGVCKNVRECPRVREEYKLGIPLTVCAYIGGQPIVCCPRSGGSPSRTSTITIPQPEAIANPSSGKRISVQSETNFLMCAIS